MERGIHVNKELLKTELLTSPFLELVNKDLLENDEVILIILSGSRTSGLALDKSDIDIAVRTLKSWNLNSNIKGEFQGIHLHWWLSPIIAGEIAWVDPIHMGLILVGQYYMNYDPENIIYLNPKYEKVIDYIRNNQPIIKLAALYHLSLYNQNEIQLWSKTARFRYSKLILPLADFYYEKNNLVRNINLLCKIKQSIRDNSIEITDEEWTEFSTALFWTVDYLNNTEFPIVEYLSYYKGLTELLAEINKK